MHIAFDFQLLSQIRCLGSYSTYSNFSLLAFHNLSEYFLSLKIFLYMYVLNKLGGRMVIKLRAILPFKIIIYACLLACPVQKTKNKNKQTNKEQPLTLNSLSKCV